MNFALTQEQRILVETLREFTKNRISPKADDMESSGKLPDDFIMA